METLKASGVGLTEKPTLAPKSIDIQLVYLQNPDCSWRHMAGPYSAWVECEWMNQTSQRAFSCKIAKKVFRPHFRDKASKNLKQMKWKLGLKPGVSLLPGWCIFSPRWYCHTRTWSAHQPAYRSLQHEGCLLSQPSAKPQPNLRSLITLTPGPN